ncbi:MAG: hypothetical protein KDK39_13995, partial [Leptospiraceae bacterium]|nr:hypothetical protein [Leptospiraceae bacterium]
MASICGLVLKRAIIDCFGTNLMFLDQTIRLMLDSLGRSEEYEFYLRKFKNVTSNCLAVIVPDENSLRFQGDALFFSLHFLKRLELFPALALAGPHALRMARRLQERDHEACLASAIIIDSSSVADVDRSALDDYVNQCTAGHRLPLCVLPNLGVPELVLTLSPLLSPRIHLLRANGGLRDRSNQTVQYFKTPFALDSLRPADGAVAALARDLIQAQGRLHISITAAPNLLKEIFTIKGAGTIVRHGSQIQVSSGLQVDMIRLRQLLETSFRRTPKNTFQIEPTAILYHDIEYRGAILLEKLDFGYYLSKFAVGPQARGEGIGMELWDVMLETTSQIAWRSRA